MLYAFIIILNALRFIQCPSWIAIQTPPEKAGILLGTLRNRLYIKTTTNTIYCLGQNQWTPCNLPPYDLQPDNAPSWVIRFLEAGFQNNSVLQAIRSDSFVNTNYYSLLPNGHVFVCPTSFSAETENIIRSGSLVWLIIPSVGIIWSIISFLNIFIKYGQPTFWDFWGRGERIK